MCHRESGYLQEIVQEVSMMQCQHVWVDGSLRDGQWFSKIFDELRERFPNYRVAIFFVNTSEEVAWKRCEARAKATGRSVPKDLFLDSLHSPDHVLRMLTPKVSSMLLAPRTRTRAPCSPRPARPLLRPTAPKARAAI